jgi:hypothetical protein
VGRKIYSKRNEKSKKAKVKKNLTISKDNANAKKSRCVIKDYSFGSIVRR